MRMTVACGLCGGSPTRGIVTLHVLYGCRPAHGSTGRAPGSWGRYIRVCVCVCVSMCMCMCVWGACVSAWSQSVCVCVCVHVCGVCVLVEGVRDTGQRD